MLSAFFREELEIRERVHRLMPRALRVAAAIRSREVVAFAPEVLLPEFTSGALRKSSPRSGAPTIALDKVREQVLDFRRLPVTYVPAEEIADSAWELMAYKKITPPDSWYLACAMQNDAELWITHEQKDRFVEHARSVHQKVFLLTERRFEDLD